MSHKWADWLHNPCRLGGPQRLIARGQNQGDEISNGPPVGGLATCYLGGLQPFTMGDKISKRGAKSALAHKWPNWRHNPCHLGGPQHFGAESKTNCGPYVAKLAT